MVNRERLLKRCAKKTGDFGPILEDICQLLPDRLQDSEVTHEVCKLAVIIRPDRPRQSDAVVSAKSRQPADGESVQRRETMAP
jgi:hypothetical protein